MVLVTKKRRPTSLHHKRRRGEHHRQSHDYTKAYWPYLPLGLIVGLGVLVNTCWGTIQHRVLSYATDTTVSGLLQETNEERVAGGLGSLVVNAQLNQAAQAKANDMASRDYWSHNTPEGNPPWIFFTNAGYQYQTAGENLAYGFDNSADTVTGWMNSPGHKANIMNTSYVDVGFGIANAPNYQSTGPETIVVAMYGSPQVLAAAPATKPAASPPAPAAAPTAQPAPTPAETPKEEINTTPTPVANPAKSTPAPVAPREVARIQLIAGKNASWSLFAVTTIATVSIAIFFIRHGLLWRRVLVKSEAFVHKHIVLDIVLVSLATLGVILTRVDGIIR